MARQATATKTAPKNENRGRLILTALFWGEYCRCAGMPVQRQCFDKLDELGILANITRNLEEFLKFSDSFNDALGCCGRAGRESAKRAKAKGVKAITPKIFQSAFDHVASVVRVARTRAGEADPQGPLC